MTIVADVLNRAADRLAQQGAWCKDAMSRDPDGTQVPPNHIGACQWCSMGAIRAETQDTYLQYRADQALADVINRDIAKWNDDPATTQDEVVTAFRKAAAL